MKPIFFKIFNIPVYGYGTMIAIGICAALLLVGYRAKKKGYDEDSILNMSILAIIMGILGGKVLYIITEIKYIIQEPSSLLDFGSGFVIYGAITGGALGVLIYCWRKKWKVFKLYDLAIPAIALAQGFGRIGCFFAGCCYGKETTLRIGVEFVDSPFAPSGVHLQPTQIYSSIFDFCLAGFLLWYDRKERKTGRVFSMYVILYSIGRFLVEFLRDDPRGKIGPLSTSQFIGIFALIFGIIIFNSKKIHDSGATLVMEESEDKFVNNDEENSEGTTLGEDNAYVEYNSDSFVDMGSVETEQASDVSENTNSQESTGGNEKTLDI